MPRQHRKAIFVDLIDPLARQLQGRAELAREQGNTTRAAQLDRARDALDRATEDPLSPQERLLWLDDLEDLLVLADASDALAVAARTADPVLAGMARGFSHGAHLLIGSRQSHAREDDRSDAGDLLAGLPARVRAGLESAGVALASDPATGGVHLALGGASLARIERGPGPRVRWSDPAFGRLVGLVMGYLPIVEELREHRGPGTIGLRELLRAQLDSEPLLAAARLARCRVEERGGFITKHYFVTHPIFGELVRLTVPRGQGHVTEVAFPSPRVVIPLRFLAELERDGAS